MKYLKFIFITILLIIIMIIPVNATILTLPDLPGEYEDYIIFNDAYMYNYSGNIYAITFNNLENMNVGTYEEYLEIYPPKDNYTYHSNDILYFRTKVLNNMEISRYMLVGGEWELKQSMIGLNTYRFGADATNSIKSSDILYSSKDVIDLGDGSVFFFKGSWMKAGMVRPMLGIIPYLIGLVIALAAFLKGWQFLFKILRKA